MESGEDPHGTVAAWVEAYQDYARHCRTGGVEDPEETQG